MTTNTRDGSAITLAILNAYAEDRGLNWQITYLTVDETPPGQIIRAGYYKTTGNAPEFIGGTKNDVEIAINLNATQSGTSGMTIAAKYFQPLTGTVYATVCNGILQGVFKTRKAADKLASRIVHAPHVWRGTFNADGNINATEKLS